MTYIKTDCLSYSDLKDASGLALFIAAGSSEEVIVTPGELSWAITLNDFTGMIRSQTSSWEGLTISDVEVRVDPASAYSLDVKGVVPGSVVIVGSVIALAHNAGRRALSTIGYTQLGSEPVNEQQSPRMAFSRWALGISQDDGFVTIREIDVLPSPDSE